MRRFLVVILALVTYPSFASGWIQKNDFGGIARHRTAAISIGTKAYMGLGHYNGAGTNVLFDDWWEYDPATNSWTQKADYLGGICYHPVSFTIGEIGYVGTGRTHPTMNQLVKDFFKYDPTLNSWTQISDFPGVGRRGAVSFVIEGMGYVGTGETSSGRTSTFYRYNPVTDNWIQISNFAGSSRLSSVAFTIGQYAYVGTGDAAGGSVNDLWQYNPLTDNWTQKADVGPTDRQEATAFALNGKGYIGTGDDFSSGNNFGDMWEYDVATDTWIQIEDFPGTARRYLSAMVLNGYAYAGLGTNGTNFKDFWMFDQSLSLLERNLENISLNVYPNPTSDYAVFQLNSDENLSFEDLTLTVTSGSGAVLESTKYDKDKKVLNTNNYNSGVYFYSINYNSAVLKSGQLIID